MDTTVLLRARKRKRKGDEKRKKLYACTPPLLLLSALPRCPTITSGVLVEGIQNDSTSSVYFLGGDFEVE